MAWRVQEMRQVQEMDVIFAIGFLCGITTMAFLAWLIVHAEWQARRKLESCVKYLERNLCCGAGIFGCKGGPRCDYDHK